MTIRPNPYHTPIFSYFASSLQSGSWSVNLEFYQGKFRLVNLVFFCGSLALGDNSLQPSPHIVFIQFLSGQLIPDRCQLIWYSTGGNGLILHSALAIEPEKGQPIGIQVLWRGWLKLHDLCEGWQLAKET